MLAIAVAVLVVAGVVADVVLVAFAVVVGVSCLFCVCC